MPSYRRRPRVPLNVLLNKVIGESLFMCHASDISEDGIFLSKLLEPKYRGKEVGLEFALPGDGGDHLGQGRDRPRREAAALGGLGHQVHDHG